MRIKLFALTFLLLFTASLLHTQQREFNRAYRLERRGKKEEALKIYRRLFKKNPKDTKAFNSLKRVYFDLKRYDEFITLAEDAYRSFPQEIFAMGIGEAYIKKGKLTEGKKILYNIVDKNGTENNFKSVATIFLTNKLYAEAGKIYLKGRKVLNNKSLFSRELSLVYYSIGDLKKSTTELLTLFCSSPKEKVWIERRLKDFFQRDSLAVLSAIRERSKKKGAEIHQFLGDVYVSIERYESAIDEYKKGSQSKALFDFAQKVLNEKRYELAIESFKEYIATNPEPNLLLISQIELGNCYYRTGRYQKAMEIYTKLLKKKDLIRKVEILFNSAMVYSSLNDDSKAVDLFQNLVKKYPSNPLCNDALFQIVDCNVRLGRLKQAEEAGRKVSATYVGKFKLGELFYLSGKFEQALKFYEEVANGNPQSEYVNDAIERMIFVKDNRDDVCLKGYATAELLIFQKKFKEAIDKIKVIINESLKLKEHSWLLLARTYGASGDTLSAIGSYRNLMENHPESDLSVVAQVEIGLLYKRMGEYEKARTEFEKILINHSKSMYAEEVRLELKNLNKK